MGHGVALSAVIYENILYSSIKYIIAPGTHPTTLYCEIIFIRWTFNFVGRTVHKFMITRKYLFLFTVQEHVHRRQTAKFSAHEIKLFHSISNSYGIVYYIL